MDSGAPEMDAANRDAEPSSEQNVKNASSSRKRPQRLSMFGVPIALVVIMLAAATFWLGIRANMVKSDLEAAATLIPQLKQEIAASDGKGANFTVAEIRSRTSSARANADSPLWTLASGLPWAGPNLNAVAEVARSADDVSTLALTPLASVYESLDWNSLLPSGEGADLKPLKSAAPSVAAAAYAVRASYERLDAIDKAQLLPQVSAPLDEAAGELQKAATALSSASDAANIAPTMLGADGRRNYLLIIQNNAEARASGGIPGALAVLTFENGKLSLGTQSSASEIGTVSPPVPVDREQQQIYTSRLGKYMQDVNLTPDFPSAAATAQAIWEKKTGQRVDGVISIDPVVLSYILGSTGPVSVNGPELAAVKASGLPTELTGDNVVRTLLSDVYAKIKEPKLQDIYFAGVAKEVFSALSTGKGEAKGLITGITRGTDEGRVLVWSASPSEQAVISKYPMSGSISGPSVSPAQFGVYFNDGTGAKMDYYVKRTVQLIKHCPADGYEQTTVRITSTNTAPADAANSLPGYVTGGGSFGVSPGSVQTNVVAYGPVQANVESASVDSQKTTFAPYLHANRPVGVIAQQLAPGETKTVEFTFGKIVQHTEPNLDVTPTVQPVKDVILPTENASCDPGQ